ncbi:transposase [Candidatus Uhrbacteria bacterium]|nr:transposase [Candidatus Uhrbacteria bacterium]
MSSSNGKYPTTEVQPRARRRTFTAAYKRKIVEEAAGCKHGEVGALLRREGLYSSQLATWRKAYEAGTLSDKPRGPRANPNAAEVKRLEHENARLQRKLAQAEAIIEAQKKLARLLVEQQEDETL